MTLSIFMIWFHLGVAATMIYLAISSHNSVKWWRAAREEVSAMDVPIMPYFADRRRELLVDCEHGVQRNTRMVWFSLAFFVFNIVAAACHYYF